MAKATVMAALNTVIRYNRIPNRLEEYVWRNEEHSDEPENESIDRSIELMKKLYFDLFFWWISSWTINSEKNRVGFSRRKMWSTMIFKTNVNRTFSLFLHVVEWEEERSVSNVSTSHRREIRRSVKLECKSTGDRIDPKRSKSKFKFRVTSCFYHIGEIFSNNLVPFLSFTGKKSFICQCKIEIFIVNQS